MKGQSSMELMLTLGIIVAFSIPVLFLFYSLTTVGSEDTAKAQADASARSFADAINLVYSQGEGASRTVLLNLPSSTQSIYVSNSEVVVNLKLSSGEFDSTAPIYAKLRSTPRISGKTGLFPLLIKNIEGHIVICDPNDPETNC